ncbi:MAG: class I SAM-dependent methyltransferase [Chitinophagaceae bacterium]|nr:class I SAM-dependent methyltransferase [Chitinophagaceae bacterium]
MGQAINKMYSSVKKTRLYRFAGRVYHKLQARQHLAGKGKGYYCPGCKKNWKSFRPLPEVWLKPLYESGWPYTVDDAETLNYKNYSCYGCGITDRDRLYILYFEKILEKNRHYNIIEFAPTPSLSRLLKKMPNVTHRTSDLFMEGVDDKLDLQDLHLYKDHSFDVFVCSHILEHVDDDIKAMKELYRILKPGGWGIAMVPIIESVTETHEDPSIKEENLRLKYFGQKDHVRLYAKADFIRRLESVGFMVKLYGVDYFGEAQFDRSGITRKSVLYIVEK